MSSGVQPDAAFVQWVVGATGKTQDAARQMVEKLAADGVNSLDDLRELWSEDSVLGVLQHVFPALVRSKIRNALAKKPRLDAGSAAAAVVEQQVSTTLARARILRDLQSSRPRVPLCRRNKPLTATGVVLPTVVLVLVAVVPTVGPSRKARKMHVLLLLLLLMCRQVPLGAFMLS